MLEEIPEEAGCPICGLKDNVHTLICFLDREDVGKATEQCCCSSKDLFNFGCRCKAKKD